MLQDTLHNTHIIIIGGSSGIGFGVARLSLFSGAKKVTIGSSNQGRVDAAVKKLNDEFSLWTESNGGGVIGVAEGWVVDVKSDEQIRGFFDKVGAFDHLVRNTSHSLFPIPLICYLFK